MRTPGAPSLVFLFYLLVFLPWIASRSRRRLQLSGDGLRPSRAAIWISTILSQVVLLALTWFVGRGFDYPFLSPYEPNIKHLAAALLAIVICFGLRGISRAVRTPDERRRMAVYSWAPRSSREWGLWFVAVLFASVAEEAAYRGVGMAILWYSFRSPWPAALVAALVFSLAHSTQGWKSASIIFVVALTMQALVVFTGTLILAVIIHAVYDLVTGYEIGRTAQRYPQAVAAS